MRHPPILLVEDNPDDVKLTQRAFKKWNIENELIVAEDGAKALEYLLGTGGAQPFVTTLRPALILLDVNLPKLNGLEVLRRLRRDEHLRRIPVVMLTSSQEQHDIVRSYDLGANSYIRKPVDFEQFAEAVRVLGIYWLVLNKSQPED
jgi:two-component system, response regulator